MAAELARLAGEVQCAKLAYILEVAALEAKSAVEPTAGGPNGLH